MVQPAAGALVRTPVAFSVEGMDRATAVLSRAARATAVEVGLLYEVAQPWDFLDPNEWGESEVVRAYVLGLVNGMRSSASSRLIGPLSQRIRELNYVDAATDERRMWTLVDAALRVVVPSALESAAASLNAVPDHARTLREHAAALRALDPVAVESVDLAAETAREAADAARDAADAYDNAYATTDAARAAANAARAAAHAAEVCYLEDDDSCAAANAALAAYWAADAAYAADAALREDALDPEVRALVIDYAAADTSDRAVEIAAAVRAAAYAADTTAAEAAAEEAAAYAADVAAEPAGGDLDPAVAADAAVAAHTLAAAVRAAAWEALEAAYPLDEDPASRVAATWEAAAAALQRALEVGTAAEYEDLPIEYGFTDDACPPPPSQTGPVVAAPATAVPPKSAYEPAVASVADEWRRQDKDFIGWFAVAGIGVWLVTGAWQVAAMAALAWLAFKIGRRL